LTHEIKQRYERRLARDTAFLTSRIDVAFRRNPFRSLHTRFVIAAAPRTGSTLLCEMLLPHGAVVGESLLPIHVIKACADNGGISLGTYCEQYLWGNARRGVFGTKGWPPLLVPLYLCGEFPTHMDEWRFVHLTRIDVVKQAISKVIAARTLAWKSRDAAVRPVDDDEFDAAEILAAVKTSIAENQAWNEFFELFSIDPLRITYEDLAKDPPGVAASVAAYLGLTGPPLTRQRVMEEPLTVQSSDLNARWEERFLQLGLSPLAGISGGGRRIDATEVAPDHFGCTRPEDG
jgi:LPS sulfotransferase NodH